MIALFVGLPKIAGVPVFVDILDLGGDNNHYLSSDKISKTKVSDAEFALPSKYKRVEKHEQLFVNKDTQQDVEIMLFGGH